VCAPQKWLKRDAVCGFDLSWPIEPLNGTFDVDDIIPHTAKQHSQWPPMSKFPSHAVEQCSDLLVTDTVGRHHE